MTQLLVSVRSRSEFAIAARAGIRFIDVKEPRRGSLGAPSLEVLRSIAAAAEPDHVISVALGELLDDNSIEPNQLPDRIDYAKLGLAGCVDVPAWRKYLQAKLTLFPVGVAPVAVAYADWQAARSPRIKDVLDAGIELGCSAFLIDTFAKQTGSLLTHLSLEQIVDLIQRASRAGLLVALAGSLDPTSIRKLQPLRAGLLAVRSAACRGRRTGQIEAAAIRELNAMCSSHDQVPGTADGG